ncbi:MAG: hypothetical protein IKT00_04380 [Prevotella sp.]|nr:hypothetical protein [Prevotella sp.]
MARKKKKNSISPDELLLNFADWTETANDEKSEVTLTSEQSVSSDDHKLEPESEPNVDVISSDGFKSVKKTVAPTETDASIPADLQYMEDTMFWALRQIDGIDDKNQTRLIAMETASMALTGIALHNIYELQSYAYGRVDGYQLVALYYASFAVAFPNMLESIPLNYDPQFHAAQERFNEFIANHS